MIRKKKFIIITVLAVCCVIIAVWSIMRYNAKHELVEQFNSDLASRFDDIMESTSPLIDNYATAMVGRADSIDAIARRAKADNDRAYSDGFSILWEQYLRTPVAGECLYIMSEYEYLKLSPVYQMLTNSGDRRQEEADALQKMSRVGVMLKEPYFLDYDSVISVSKTARQYIADCLKVMEPYRSKQTDVRAWREITPQKYFKMFEKYNQK
jgi:hypothetical protein